MLFLNYGVPPSITATVSAPEILRAPVTVKVPPTVVLPLIEAVPAATRLPSGLIEATTVPSDFCHLCKEVV
jgi:hypothetical protein